MNIFCFTFKKKRKILSDRLLENEILEQSISITWRYSTFKLPIGKKVPVYSWKKLTVQLQRQQRAGAVSGAASVMLCHRKNDQTPLCGYFQDVSKL